MPRILERRDPPKFECEEVKPQRPRAPPPEKAKVEWVPYDWLPTSRYSVAELRLMHDLSDQPEQGAVKWDYDPIAGEFIETDVSVKIGRKPIAVQGSRQVFKVEDTTLGMEGAIKVRLGDDEASYGAVRARRVCSLYLSLYNSQGYAGHEPCLLDAWLYEIRWGSGSRIAGVEQFLSDERYEKRDIVPDWGGDDGLMGVDVERHSLACFQLFVYAQSHRQVAVKSCRRVGAFWTDPALAEGAAEAAAWWSGFEREYAGIVGRRGDALLTMGVGEFASALREQGLTGGGTLYEQQRRQGAPKEIYWESQESARERETRAEDAANVEEGRPQGPCSRNSSVRDEIFSAKGRESGGWGEARGGERVLSGRIDIAKEAFHSLTL